MLDSNAFQVFFLLATELSSEKIVDIQDVKPLWLQATAYSPLLHTIMALRNTWVNIKALQGTGWKPIKAQIVHPALKQTKQKIAVLLKLAEPPHQSFQIMFWDPWKSTFSEKIHLYFIYKNKFIFYI